MTYRPGHPVVALFALVITIAPLLGAGLAALMAHTRAAGLGEVYALALMILAWTIERACERSISPATTSAADAR